MKQCVNYKDVVSYKKALCMTKANKCVNTVRLAEFVCVFIRS